MNIFNSKTAWKNTEFIPLKLCIASIFTLIGSHFSIFVSQHKYIFVIIFIITLIMALYLWMTKMKREN